MKRLIRVLGIDDGYFKPRSNGKTLLIGVLYRLDQRLEGVLKREIGVDALDSTEKIIDMANNSRFKGQIACLLLDGVNFAGFNIVDLPKLHKKTKLPIIIVFRKQPNMQKIEEALSSFKDAKKRVHLIANAGNIYPFKNIFFQCFGIDKADAKAVLRKTCVHSNLPEPIRIAHLIASAATLGESTHP